VQIKWTAGIECLVNSVYIQGPSTTQYQAGKMLCLLAWTYISKGLNLSVLLREGRGWGIRKGVATRGDGQQTEAERDRRGHRQTTYQNIPCASIKK
jgi:hypothetical protein